MQKIIDISTPDDGLGDVLRTGFDKTNQNFTELYNVKVDKIAGKGLSENDFTDADKTKLAGIEAGAQVNVNADFGENDPDAPSYILNKPPALYSAVGHFHFSDLETQITPLAVLRGVPKKLTNDALGAYTELDYAPYGVSAGFWNTTNNQFDFSNLTLGDSLLVRTDLHIITTSANQTFTIYLKLGIGTASEYDLLIDRFNVKTIITDLHVIKDVSFSIDNDDWNNAPAEVYILSDDDATIKVNGWYVPIIRKSVNIIDFNSDPLKLDKVTSSGVERAYIINADGSQGTKATSEFGLTQTALNLKENIANKATNLTSPDDTKYPTTLAVVNENKKATITVELINQLITDFYAPNALRINSTALISGSGTITLKVNDVAYTLGNLITQGQKITAETTTASVYNLISIYE
jgi:hypothetical protein